MIAAMALLLAVVVATEPITLAPRTGTRPYMVAGLLMGVGAYSSIFAFVGGVLALLPLLWLLIRSPGRSRLAWLAMAVIIPALPLSYIYLGADARAGIVFAQPFTAWARQSGITLIGFVGVAVALVTMVLEVGWLWFVGRGLDRGDPDGSVVRTIGNASALVLASTCIIGFAGSNNWALRATIVPVVLLAAYVGRGFATRGEVSHEAGEYPGLDRGMLTRVGAVALALATVAHLNGTALLLDASLRSPAYATETAACKAAILAINRGSDQPATQPGRNICRDKLSAYHIEQPFSKRRLSPEDRELMGAGFGFLDGG
jgi:hypothetical protein